MEKFVVRGTTGILTQILSEKCLKRTLVLRWTPTMVQNVLSLWKMKLTEKKLEAFKRRQARIKRREEKQRRKDAYQLRKATKHLCQRCKIAPKTKTGKYCVYCGNFLKWQGNLAYQLKRYDLATAEAVELDILLQEC